MLSRPIPIQRVKPIAGWIAEIVECIGGFDHLQADESALLNVRRQFPTAFTTPDFLSFWISEGSDHLPRPTCTASKVNVATATIVLTTSNAVMVASRLAWQTMPILLRPFLLWDFHLWRRSLKVDLARRV
jgi:hypothetical protein